MVEVSIRTGLRRGEVCGLKWRHIDAANLLTHLDSQLILEGGKVTEGPVKERRAKGAIPIDRDLLEMLQAQPKRSEYVFTTEDGKPIRPDNYSRDWKQFRARQAKRGVNTVGLTLHSLRTTFISLHLQNQTDIRTIAELVNHADPAFTLRKYARSNDEVKRKAQNRLANELKKRRKRAQQNHPQPQPADPTNAKRSKKKLSLGAEAREERVPGRFKPEKS